ncbi:hypothetical protein [Patulibacter sp.]|uniref:hypothetical protein n=1 Tax=Patulibacter sp. TaxID=1912859 RepID=UPI0027218B07|nr:hypothetical protein [Patulibacter sp.]MDO9407550.1 hypothetical protein [Patulibacter sp.]
MRTPPRTPGTLLLGTALLLLVPAGADAAYDGGVRSVQLGDARPGAVSRPLTIRVAQDPMISQGPREVRLAVQGFALDPGTSSGRRIGTVDFESSLGPFTGFAVNTAGPGDGAPGRWSLNAPAIGSVSAGVRPGTDLDDQGTPVAAAGATLLAVKLPDLPFGARVSSVTIKLNVDDNGCATATPGAVNPAAGSYRVRTFVTATDASTKLTDVTTRIRADADVGGVPKGCPVPPPTGGGPVDPSTPAAPAAVRPSVRLSAPVRRVAPGKVLRVRLRVAGGPVEVRVRRGTKTVKRLRKVGPSGRTFAFRAPRADAGRVVRLTFTPKGGRSRSLNVRVTR